MNYQLLKAIILTEAQTLEKELKKNPLFNEWQNKIKAAEYCGIKQKEKEGEKGK